MSPEIFSLLMVSNPRFIKLNQLVNKKTTKICIGSSEIN